MIEALSFFKPSWLAVLGTLPVGLGCVLLAVAEEDYERMIGYNRRRTR
jgi:hypothetical protein